MKIITNTLLDQLVTKATHCEIKRVHYELHANTSDPVRRFINVMTLGTYVRPHRHSQPGLWELMTPLRGKAAILIFSHDKVKKEWQVTERIEISPSGANQVVEIPPNVWHTVTPIVNGTAFLEMKPDHTLVQENDFATWAPALGSPDIPEFISWLQEALPGDQPPWAEPIPRSV